MPKVLIDISRKKATIILPDSLVNLYSLKKGQEFELKSKEQGDLLFINLVTKIQDMDDKE